jgi:hypothetical protein
MFVFDETIVRLYRAKANARMQETSLQMAAELSNRGEPHPPSRDLADIRPPIWYWANEKMDETKRLHSANRAEDLQGILEKSQIYASLAQASQSPVGGHQAATLLVRALATDPSYEQLAQKISSALGLAMYKK